jgi:hypothetical protein
VIELHDDDAVYFEVLLYYIHEHVWNSTIAQKKNHKFAYSFAALSLTPIGVYELADKYGIKGLKASAVDLMPPTIAALSLHPNWRYMHFS